MSAASGLSSTMSTGRFSRSPSALGGSGGRHAKQRTCRYHRQLDDHLGAHVGPGLSASMVPPCSSTIRRTSVSPIPRPPWGGRARVTPARRDRKLWAKVRTDSDPVITDADRHARVASLGNHLDSAARVGVLRGIGQQLTMTCSSLAASPSSSISSTGSDSSACDRALPCAPARRRPHAAKSPTRRYEWFAEQPDLA